MWVDYSSTLILFAKYITQRLSPPRLSFPLPADLRRRRLHTATPHTLTFFYFYSRLRPAPLYHPLGENAIEILLGFLAPCLDTFHKKYYSNFDLLDFLQLVHGLDEKVMLSA